MLILAVTTRTRVSPAIDGEVLDVDRPVLDKGAEPGSLLSNKRRKSMCAVRKLVTLLMLVSFANVSMFPTLAQQSQTGTDGRDDPSQSSGAVDNVAQSKDQVASPR
jgi:hypothetical protein